MNCIKKRSLDALISGLNKYEDSKNAAKKADFTDLKSFVKDYLNTPEPKQRKKLAEEFRKRHFELAQFFEDNAELILAETKLKRIVNGDNVSDDIDSPFEELTTEELRKLANGK